LFMNAACTLKPVPGGRAGEVIREHQQFWEPVIEAVVNAILAECKKANKGGLRKFGCNVALYKYVSFYLFLFIINDDVD